MTCRVFGPPLRTEDDTLGVCELCYNDATEEQIAGCEVHLDADPSRGILESTLTVEAEHEAALSGNTIVAWALIP